MILTEHESLHIASKAESLLLVEQLIDNLCVSTKISDDAYGNILVALTEAVNNAIYHGNKSDETKFIDITLSSSDTSIVFTVEDEGSGFDFENLPDPTNPENVEKPNGRGVFLMRSLAEKVSFEKNGSKVVLEFNI